VVDWVLLELRSGTDATTKVGTRAALLKSDGTIVDLDGTSAPAFLSTVPGTYYIIVHHRNHLSVMSATTQTFSPANTQYDFTTGTDKYYGTAAKGLGGSVFGMYGGENDGDKLVTVLDYNAVGAGLFTSGYLIADHDMDGILTVLDYNPVGQNLFIASNVP
jgi:hypothetical protein